MLCECSSVSVSRQHNVSAHMSSYVNQHDCCCTTCNCNIIGIKIISSLQNINLISTELSNGVERSPIQSKSLSLCTTNLSVSSLKCSHYERRPSCLSNISSFPNFRLMSVWVIDNTTQHNIALNFRDMVWNVINE